MEKPHPYRVPAAENTRHPPQFGHSGTVTTFEATAATVRFNIGGVALGPAATAHDRLVALCNRLH